MKDRVAGAPGQYSATVSAADLQKLQNGEPFAIQLKRDDAPIVEGTPYSKATVLPDSVAKKLCPDIEDPTPADAFSAIVNRGVVSQGNDGFWTYRQWANGMVECWTTIDSLGENGEALRINLPCPFDINADIKMFASFNNGTGLHNVIPFLESYDILQAYEQKVYTLQYCVRAFDVLGGYALEDLSFISMHLYIVGQWKETIDSGGSYSDVTAKIEDDVLIVE